MRHPQQQGFTLLELMVVLTIVATLAAISLPVYQGYVAKTQAKAAYAEVSQGRSQFEVRVNDQEPIASASDIGLPVAAGRCRNVQVAFDANTGAGHISCTAVGGSRIDGRAIVLERNSNGSWTCTTEIEAAYRPPSCQGD